MKKLIQFTKETLICLVIALILCIIAGLVFNYLIVRPLLYSETKEPINIIFYSDSIIINEDSIDLFRELQNGSHYTNKIIIEFEEIGE